MVEFTINLHSKTLGKVMIIKRNLQIMMDYHREIDSRSKFTVDLQSVQ